MKPWPVERHPEQWRSIDDRIWITVNVFEDGRPSDVRLAHLSPETGTTCKHSGAYISDHTIVSREPLTITASIACGACSIHGWITDGHWRDA